MNISDLAKRIPAFGAAVVASIAVAVTMMPAVSAQRMFPSGQNIAPAYEGWEQNPDGSFNFVFGYMNRNWEEEINVPIGPENTIEPGGPDQGQPTHFYPRRNRFVFRIRVPKDFGTKELVWTLTSHGKTERAYATLKPDYVIDDVVIMNNTGGAGAGGGNADSLENRVPTLHVEGPPKRSVRVGEPIVLTAVASDDGKPKPSFIPAIAGRPRATPHSATGLRLSWFVYRGPGRVTFDPPQLKVWEDHRDGMNSPWSAGWQTPPVPPDGKWVVRAALHEPGTYVLRCQAHDGGLSTSQDITMVVSQ